MLGALADGETLSSEVLATGVCSEQLTKASETISPEIKTGSFIISAYVGCAQRWVSHTQRDACQIV